MPSSRHFLGYGPVYQVPHIHFGAPWELALYALLGILLGHCAPPIWRCWSVRGNSSSRLHWSLPVTLALGRPDRRGDLGWAPRVWGNGYSVVNDMLNDRSAIETRALVLVAKLISTAASVGSGARAAS